MLEQTLSFGIVLTIPFLNLKLQLKLFFAGANVDRTHQSSPQRADEIFVRLSYRTASVSAICGTDCPANSATGSIGYRIQDTGESWIVAKD